MKVLVIGGTKFIGKAIVNQCLKQKHQVVLFNRGTSNELNLPLIKGDIKELVNYKEELLKVNADIVIHCICNNEQNAIDCVEVFKNTNTKVIVLSSQDCYKDFQNFVRGKEPEEFPVDENSPVTDIKHYWEGISAHGNKYDKNLMTNVFTRAFEDKILNSTIFRLAMIYGPEDYQYQYRHASIIKRIIANRKKAVLSATEQSKIWPFGYIENVASALVFSFDKTITDGKIYNLGESKSRTWRKWHELFAQYCNWEFEFSILPDELLNDSDVLLNSIPQHMITSSDLYSIETGFVEPVSLEEAIKNTFDYALKNQQILGDKDDYAKEDTAEEKYLKFLSTN